MNPPAPILPFFCRAMSNLCAAPVAERETLRDNWRPLHCPRQIILSLPDIRHIRRIVASALKEDIADGDLTASLIPENAASTATIISRDSAVFCGAAWAAEVFHALNPDILLNWRVSDGDHIEPDQTLVELTGPSRDLLSGERAALNFLQTLSGVASVTARYVAAVAGTGVRILDTRKTIPGLRLEQKYAVLCGGGHNHRVGLYDGILIKENHIAAAGGIQPAVAAAKRIARPGVLLEVEVESMDELRQALEAGAPRMLLDNFDNDALREAVSITTNRAELEASGNITLDTIRAVAETGVDYISIGALTKHLHAVDLSMRFR